jgi:hypothetical protein
MMLILALSLGLGSSCDAAQALAGATGRCLGGRSRCRSSARDKAIGMIRQQNIDECFTCGFSDATGHKHMK